MKRAQESAKAGRPYALLLADVIGSLSDSVQEGGAAFFESRPVKHRGILVVSTDKGLCGALNANLFRLVYDVDSSAKFVAVGKRATQYLSRARRDDGAAREWRKLSRRRDAFSISSSCRMHACSTAHGVTRSTDTGFSGSCPHRGFPCGAGAIIPGSQSLAMAKIATMRLHSVPL